jgi:hypothetical protein
MKTIDEEIQEKWNSLKEYDCRRATFTQENIDFMAKILNEIIDLECVKILTKKS